MVSKLDDLFASSMKKPRKLLDLSKVKIFCFEDFDKYMEKVPDMKTTPEKIETSDVKIYDKDFSFTSSKKEQFELDPCLNGHRFPYDDALPTSMKGVRMDDLASVDIHWKMLTDLRPVNKMEDDYFSRIVDLGKFRKNTRIEETKLFLASLSTAPGSSAQAKAISLGFVTYKSRRGTLETKVKSCKDCGLELCTGTFCKLQHYESYARVIMDKDELEAEDAKGFSLKGVIDQANAKPAVADVKSRRGKPSLKAMISKGGKRKSKKKKS